MVDLGSLFGRMEGIVSGLIESAGTTISVRRDPDGTLTAATNPVTLAVTPVALEIVAVDVAAIAVPFGAGEELPMPAAAPAQPGDYRFVAGIDLAGVIEGDLVTVDACLDAELVGRQFLVYATVDSSAGVARILLAHPVRRGAIGPVT